MNLKTIFGILFFLGIVPLIFLYLFIVRRTGHEMGYVCDLYNCKVCHNIHCPLVFRRQP